MAYLNELKAAVDAGKTARLRRWRSILHWFVGKNRIDDLEFYLKQAEGYTNPDGIVIVQAETAFYPTWSALVDSLGYDAESSGWQLTDEPLADYLPPERKVQEE